MNELELMKLRLCNKAQQDRMIQDKRKSFDKAVLYSYQGAHVKKIGEEKTAPALINPNATKQDYDDKIISIGFEYEYSPGTVFEWINGTKWLVYLQDLTELAYFRGDVRKCSYEISWRNSKGELKNTFAALRGPKETTIESSITSNISIDSPNHTLYIMLPKNDDTVEYFTRYSEFYLKNSKICWKVQAIDDISMPGILEINAIEYYSNKDADDIDQGLVDEKLIIPQENSRIEGEAFIKPKRAYEYKAPEDYIGDCWQVIPTNVPVVVKANNNTATITWTKSYIGEFKLCFGELEKTIVVESLF